MSVGNDTVEMKLGVDKTNSGGSNILVGIETVPADSHANAIWFSLTRSHGANEVGVGDLATGGDLMGINEVHGVVADDVVTTSARFGEALGAASPFVGKGSCPDERVRSAEERVDIFGLAGGRIVHFAGNRRGIVLDRLGEGEATMSARIEQNELRAKDECAKIEGD